MSKEDQTKTNDKTRKVLPRAREIKNTAESKRITGGEHPTAAWVKTYDSRCLK